MSINGQPYKVRRLAKQPRGCVSWGLKKSDGTEYVLCRWQGALACTCTDQSHRGVKCKHIGAMQALGLLSRRLIVSPAFLAAQPPKGGAA